ncbi:FCD domain-containing protein [Planotetraspora sp. A-T 1434]|uniref:FadR/GntR family transcriptional regulator n=1 Tax=Planotetraspora sp. A-T 1434 TaxID=2979219 RepID=UPI0021BE2407|nr:FCD domain-containing protein [Planotetraspora sp. A-T 1434]MCT9931286.1 FCD domain-containing protein [Planotetraspora sp. A-T 1434]
MSPRPAPDEGASPPEPAPAPTSYRPGYELVAERLLAYIAEEKLQPGDRLPTEQRLAEIFQSGRSVTREAIKVLAAMGRIKVRKGAGIFVAVPSNAVAEEQVAYFQPTNLEHVLMMFDHRRLIEGETARRSAGLATPLQVRAIREAAEQSLNAAPGSDHREFARFDRLFHDAVAAASGNVFLQAAVTTLRDFAQQSDLLLFHGDLPGSLTVAARQHLAVAEAIASGEPEAAAAAMVAHIDTTQAQFERKIRDRLLNVVGEPRDES